ADRRKRDVLHTEQPVIREREVMSSRLAAMECEFIGLAQQPCSPHAQAIIAGRQSDDGALADVEWVSDGLIAPRLGQHFSRKRRAIRSEGHPAKPPIRVVAPAY